MQPGRLDRRCAFQRRDTTPDDYGNVTGGGWSALLTVWGALDERAGREAVRAGRLESAAAGTVQIRDSAAARGITAADRVVIDGRAYAIREVRPPQRTGMIEMVVERGVGDAS